MVLVTVVVPPNKPPGTNTRTAAIETVIARATRPAATLFVINVPLRGCKYDHPLLVVDIAATAAALHIIHENDS